MEYIKNSFKELKKVTIPPFKEVVSSSLNVVVFMFIVSFIIFLIDLLMGLQKINFFGFSWKGILGTIYALF
jgi:preprotein translocase SecE subunit